MRPRQARARAVRCRKTIAPFCKKHCSTFWSASACSIRCANSSLIVSRKPAVRRHPSGSRLIVQLCWNQLASFELDGHQQQEHLHMNRLLLTASFVVMAGMATAQTTVVISPEQETV